MSLEENKAIVRRLIEAMNEQNLALLDEFIAPDKVESFKQGMIQVFPISMRSLRTLSRKGIWCGFV